VFNRPVGFAHPDEWLKERIKHLEAENARLKAAVERAKFIARTNEYLSGQAMIDILNDVTTRKQNVKRIKRRNNRTRLSG